MTSAQIGPLYRRTNMATLAKSLRLPSLSFPRFDMNRLMLATILSALAAVRLACSNVISIIKKGTKWRTNIPVLLQSPRLTSNPFFYGKIFGKIYAKIASRYVKFIQELKNFTTRLIFQSWWLTFEQMTNSINFWTLYFHQLFSLHFGGLFWKLRTYLIEFPSMMGEAGG